MKNRISIGWILVILAGVVFLYIAYVNDFGRAKAMVDDFIRSIKKSFS